MIVTVELVVMIMGPATLAVGIVLWFIKQINGLRREISDQKLYAEKHFATKDGLTAAVHSMQDAIENLSGRIDRLLDAISQDRRS